jgi:hypothetical protein
MQCAHCEKDFKEDESSKGFYTNQNEHFMRPFRVFGYACPFCGFNNTMFQIPIEIPFMRSSTTYDKLDGIVKEFRNQVEEFYKSKNKYKVQLDLYDKNEQN